MKNKYILKSLLLLSFLAMGTNAIGQTTKERPDVATSNTYECGIPIIAPQQCDRVQNKENAIDNDETTFANLTANAGLIGGIGAHSSTLTLTHNSVVPTAGNPIPNYYVKTSVPGNNGLFGALLGGSLGDLLGGVLGAVLFGNESATFELRNSNSSVISGDIYSGNFSSNPNMDIVVAGNGDYYILMRPTAPFNNLRVNLSLAGVAGLLNETELNVYDAFYYDEVTRCDVPIMSSYTATGGILDLSVLPSNPVENAHLAIDNDIENTYSTIGITSLLNVSTASTVEQLFHLPTTVDDKSVRITMQLPTSLLNLAIAQQSSVEFYNDGDPTPVASVNINEDVIGLDVLGLINTNDVAFSFAAAPRDANGNIIPFDKVGIRINIPVGLDLAGGSNIRVYDFTLINDEPITQKVCTKEFIRTVGGVDIRETKFNITDIIPNYNAVNTYTISDANGNAVDLSIEGNEWQPLGSYVIRGITGSDEYCPDENVSIMAIQDTQYRINGKIAISMPLDANDDETPDAQHTFNLADYNVIDREDENADVTADYNTIQIFAEDNPTVDLMGQTIEYDQIGSYNYYVKTTNIANPDCDLVRRVTVYVYDKAECEYRFEQLMADQESASTVSLLGIPLGGTSESARAIDGDLSTHGSVFNVVSLLGIGTTSQKLMFTEGGGNKVIEAGTPVTVKIGQDYSLLQVIGGLTIQAVNTNGDAVGSLLSVDEIDLANVLVGDNIFEFTFIPEIDGVPIDYSGVQVNLGSVLGLGNTMRVYGAFIDERTPVADATCNPNITVDGAEIPGNLDATLLLNTSTRDVLWGTQDIGLGVATLLSSTLYGYQAADAINDPGNPLHGTPDFDTYAEFNAAAGALNQMSLTVKFKEIARPGDKVRFVFGREGGSILDANVLGNALTIQRYMGTIAIGEPVVVDANALIQLDLLGLINPQATGKYAYMLDGIGAPFDRVEVRSGNIVTLELLSTSLRIYDVSLLPYFAFDSDDETTTLCTSAPFEIEKMDPCTSYEISYAYPTLDVDGNITAWNDIVGSEVVIANETEDRVQYRLQMKELLREYNEAGTLYMKVITTRQECLYGDAQYLKVKIAACGAIVNPMIRTRLNTN